MEQFDLRDMVLKYKLRSMGVLGINWNKDMENDILHILNKTKIHKQSLNTICVQSKWALRIIQPHEDLGKNNRAICSHCMSKYGALMKGRDYSDEGLTKDMFLP